MRRKQLPVALFYLVCGVVLTVTAGWCVSQWHACNQLQIHLVKAGLAGRQVGELQAELAQLNDQYEILQREMDAVGKQLALLNRRRMPLTATATQRSILKMLNLAADCGVRIRQVQQIQTQGVGKGSSGSVRDKKRRAFWNRFAVDATPRPVLKLEAEAAYPAIQRFVNRLAGLPWLVVPVQFQITRRRTTHLSESDMETDMPGVQRHDSPGDGNALQLTLLLAL